MFDHHTGQILEVSGAHIYFETTGNPSGLPLVLLHGGLGCMTDFNSVLGFFLPQFKVIGIDFRGHGKSTLGDDGLSYARYQKDVEAVLAYLGVGTCSVLGFSDGGIVAYRMAQHSPVQINKLITIGAQWRLEPDDPALPMLGGMTGETWGSMFPESVEYYAKINPQPDFDRLVKNVVRLWTDLSADGYPGEGVCQIQAPVLLIRGDEDQLLSLSETSALYKRLSHVHLLNIPFAGHEVHKDAAEMLMSVVNSFLLQ